MSVVAIIQDSLASVSFGWLLVIGFGFGAIIGSFLNVAIYRFHTGKSLNGHSHCMSCGRQLAWYELFPLVSYVALRGTCRTCGCHITFRYFLVELLTGGLFAATFLVSTDGFVMLLLWLIFSLLVMIVVYDIHHFIIPDTLTIAVTFTVAVLSGYRIWQGYPFERIAIDIGAAAVGASFFLFLWLISKGAWLGFGDVKLAFPLGWLVSASYVFSFVVMSFWIGAILSLSYIGIQKIKRGKQRLHLGDQGLTIKSAVPFAPFLIASCVLVLLFSINVLDFFSFTL